MFEVRYPLSALASDYLRGLLLLGICSVTTVTLEPDNPVIWLFGALTLAAVIFPLRTVSSHVAKFKLTEAGIGRSPWPTRYIAWGKLDGIALRYYSLRRNRTGGWMTMTLKSGPTSIEIESSLPHFQAIVARAARAAKDNNVTVDRITLDNLNAIGVNLSE